MGLDAAGSSLFVGRADEVRRLVALTGVDGSGADHGSVVLSGDAGIGKTRLLAEVARTAREHGWTVLVGHCLSEAGQSLPYLPFLEVFGRLQALAPDAVDRAVHAHPALARLLPGHRAQASDPATAEPGAADDGGPGLPTVATSSPRSTRPWRRSVRPSPCSSSSRTSTGPTSPPATC